MTHDELIAVIRALANYRQINMNWYRDIEKTAERLQDFIGNPDLVVTTSKQPHYRPFKNALEVMTAIMIHRDWVMKKDSYDHYDRILLIKEDCIRTADIGTISFEDAFNEIGFSDGRPFGVKEDRL